MNGYIRINKLFDLLPEPECELKAIQVYFNEFKTNKFNKNHIDCHILCCALVRKDNSQKMLSYKELCESKRIEWLTIPKLAFDTNLLNSCGKLMKIYIKAERVNYEIESTNNNLFYHKCVVKICPNQQQLKELVKKRNDVLKSISSVNTNANEIDDDEIDPDIF